MGEVGRITAFVLLIVGTLGLLANEFILYWGRPATATFAAFNFLGLVILALMTWGIKKK